MTWSDNRGGPKRRVKPVIFAEKVQIKKPVPAWVASHQAAPHALSGWLSTRSVPPPPSSATSAPPAGEKRHLVPPSVHPGQRASVEPNVAHTAEGMVQAMEARALTLGQSESVSQASRSAFPQAQDRAFDGMAQHLPAATAFLASEAIQTARLEATITALETSVEELSLLRGKMMEETEEQLVILAATDRKSVV